MPFLDMSYAYANGVEYENEVKKRRKQNQTLRERQKWG